MYQDAEVYSQHRSMQIRDTQIFLADVVSKMDWSKMEEDVVMDLGCGPGTCCTEFLLPFLPNVKGIIGIDVLPSMVEYAKTKNANPKVEYHVANIEDEYSITPWEQKTSKIISVYCFNWVKDQDQAFRNVYKLLKPGGEAAFLFAVTSPLHDITISMMKHPKWERHFQHLDFIVPESHLKKFDASTYKEMLENVGFLVSFCHMEERVMVYESDEDAKASFASRCILTNHIPEDQTEEFKQDLFEAVLELLGRNKDGKPMMYYTPVSILFRKPKA